MYIKNRNTQQRRVVFMPRKFSAAAPR